MRDTTKASILVCAFAVLAGTAQGQDAPSRPDDRKPPLQGPAVPQNRPPHVDDQFGDGMKPGKEGRREAVIPMRAYAEVIDKLRGEKAPADIRLSAEQEHQIGAIEQEFRDAAKEFAQKMRQERGQNQDKPQGDKPERPRREMAQEFERSGPKPGDYQTRVWAALNPKQQTFVKGELDKIKEDLQKRRGEEYMQRRLEQRKGTDQQAGPRPVAGDQPAPMRERAQRIMRRMSQLPAEDRERILKRLEDELDRRGIKDPEEGQPPKPPQPPPR